MQRKPNIFSGLALFFICGLMSFAQEREYIYDHFNISSGLIMDNVFKVFFDSEGHAWIITYNGLQKYNGFEFETYTSSKGNSKTLSSNFVADMFEDREGDLIVILEDGIDIFDKSTNEFRNLLSDLPFSNMRRNEINLLSSAVQDKAGSIWVNCNNKLVRIDSAKQDFVVYQDEFQGRFILNPDSTILWIITPNTIKKYELGPKLLTITSLSDVEAPVSIDQLNTIFYDSHDICWLGTSKGLFVFDDSNLKIVDPSVGLPGGIGSGRAALNNDITALYEDYQGNLWIASGTTIYKTDRNTGNVDSLYHEFENPNSIIHEQITGIHGNRSGQVWITYLNEGFTRINIRTNNFKSYRFRSQGANGLGGNTVRSIHKDQQGYLWLGFYNNGLDRIDTETGRISHFKHKSSDSSSVCSNYIASLLMDSRGRLWVGSHNNGLCYADRAYEEQLTFHIPEFLNGSDEIYHMQEDAMGRIWIATRTGLGLYDYSRLSFQWVLKEHNVQSFIIDRQTIWIASWDNGICKLAFKGDQFASRYPQFDSIASINYGSTNTGIAHENTASKSIGNLRNGISVYQDLHGHIWLGTFDRGLIRVIESDKGITFDEYGRDEGAPGHAIYGLIGDDNENIWISTDNGIGKFDPSGERFDNFFREDGLVSNFFMWKSYFKAPDGELFFGSVDGLNCFYPDEILTDTLRPKILFSEFRVQNQVVQCGDMVHGDIILDRHIAFKDTLVLNHWNKNFSFRFYATGTVNPNRLLFSHRLVGFDEGWIEDDIGSRMASYNNLKAGTYLLRVKATNHLSDLVESYAEKMVIILPPWWKTRIAILIYILFILCLVLVIAHSLIRFLALKQELIYNEKLHQSKLMFFTNLSHEFKTPLSLIKAPLEEILNEKGLSPYIQKNLNIARKNADNLLNLVNELMEFRRTDTGNSKLRAEPIELSGYISEVAAQFECIAEQKGVHFYYSIPEKPQKIWVDPKKFRRILNNLLDNALKYTSEEGLVTLSVIPQPSRFRFNPDYHTLQINQGNKNMDYIGILVTDNGLGISRDSLPRIFDRFYQIDAERADQHIGSGIGLALVKNLILMHGGEIHVASERAKGTEILVLLPLGMKHLKEEEKNTAMQSKPRNESHIGENRPSLPNPGLIDHNGSNVGKPAILLVEDHAELRQYLKDQLSEEFRIYVASNGQEGLNMLRKARPDLIITDWIMPEMDGPSFIREIRSNQETVSIPVIILTAKDEFRDRKEGLELGADQVITKPFNMQLLRTQVKRMIDNNINRMHHFSLENIENVVEVRNNRDVHFLEEMERIIRKHIRNTALNAGLIATELGMSRTALYDKTKSITGHSIGEYIQRIRLKQAIKYMLYENVTVSEVYVMVGFSSSSYMIRLFRKYYQTTPGEYIKNYLKASSN